jgi:hypothetical protein
LKQECVEIKESRIARNVSSRILAVTDVPQVAQLVDQPVNLVGETNPLPAPAASGEGVVCYRVVVVLALFFLTNLRVPTQALLTKSQQSSRSVR